MTFPDNPGIVASWATSAPLTAEAQQEAANQPSTRKTTADEERLSINTRRRMLNAYRDQED